MNEEGSQQDFSLVLCRRLILSLGAFVVCVESFLHPHYELWLFNQDGVPRFLMRTSWIWCLGRELFFCSSCHSCVPGCFFPAVWRKCCISHLQKELKSSELFLTGSIQTIFQTCRKKLFVCFYRSSVSDAAFSSDSSDLYDFHLSFVFPCFHPTNTCFLSASSHFSPLLSLIFSISAPESASFSSRHVLPLTKPLVM